MFALAPPATVHDPASERPAPNLARRRRGGDAHLHLRARTFHRSNTPSVFHPPSHHRERTTTAPVTVDAPRRGSAHDHRASSRARRRRVARTASDCALSQHRIGPSSPRSFFPGPPSCVEDVARVTRARARSSRTPSRGTMSSSRICGTGRGYGITKAAVAPLAARSTGPRMCFFPLFFFCDVFATRRRRRRRRWTPTGAAAEDSAAAALELLTLGFAHAWTFLDRARSRGIRLTTRAFGPLAPEACSSARGRFRASRMTLAPLAGAIPAPPSSTSRPSSPARPRRAKSTPSSSPAGVATAPLPSPRPGFGARRRSASASCLASAARFAAATAMLPEYLAVDMRAVEASRWRRARAGGGSCARARRRRGREAGSVDRGGSVSAARFPTAAALANRQLHARARASGGA